MGSKNNLYNIDGEITKFMIDGVSIRTAFCEGERFFLLKDLAEQVQYSNPTGIARACVKEGRSITVDAKPFNIATRSLVMLNGKALFEFLCYSTMPICIQLRNYLFDHPTEMGMLK